MLRDDAALRTVIGTRLADARVAVGYSQSQLAREAGTNQGTVANIEAGRHAPGSLTLKRICDVLCVCVDDVLADP